MWKVAYADFVTAMMAFFLLLWLLNAVSQEQLEGISDYFSPISTTKSTTGGGGLLHGKTVAPRGVFEVDKTSRVEVTYEPPAKPGSARDDASEGAGRPSAATETVRAVKYAVPDKPSSQDDTPEELVKLEKNLRSALTAAQDLKDLSKHVIIDQTHEGLRIQIVDHEKLPMFPLGESEMYQHTRKLLSLVARIIQQVPNKISISGHTDATPFASTTGYSNWELSTDRAHSARRVLMSNGIPQSRIAGIVGKAATEPFVPEKPEAPENRRLSIVLLNLPSASR
jgi:chemotaxis protein MotB